MIKITDLFDSEGFQEEKLPKIVTIPSNKELELIYSDSILLFHAIFDRMKEGAYSQEIRNEIIFQINNLDFDTKPENFFRSLEKASKMKHGAYLSKRSLSSLKKMKVFKVKDADAGFALCSKKGIPSFSEIVAVHNASEFPNIGIYLVAAARRLSGKYLECFGEHLSKTLYPTAGFETYKSLPNIKMKNGQIEILYFMKVKGCLPPK